MNANIPRWCYASFLNYFTTEIPKIPGLEDYYFDYPGARRGPNADDDRVMLRIRGPKIRLIRPIRYSYVVHATVITKSVGDLYAAQYVVGNIAALFKDIPLLKLGQEDGDNKTQVGCITLLPDNVDMVVMNLGDISPSEPVERSSITAAYEYQEE